MLICFKGSGQCTSNSEVPSETTFEPETLFNYRTWERDRKLVSGKGGNGIPREWPSVPFFFNGDRNRRASLASLASLEDFSGLETNRA